MSVKKSLVENEIVDQAEVEDPEESTVTESPAPKNGKAAAQPFDPTQYLSKFDGRDYLEVKWRLLWLRSQHPDARIVTEIVQHNEENGFALFRAEAEIPGGGKATGWGSETVRDFHDYIEAAETKAIGRALAALGYGTQFCTDFDFSANARPGKPQVVDAPVNLAEPRNIVNRASTFVRAGNDHSNGGNGGNRINESGFGGGNFTNRPTVHSAMGGRIPAQEDDFDQLPAAISPNGSSATEKQIKAIYAIGRSSKRLSESQVDDRCAEVFGILPAELTKAEASQFIDILKGEAAA
jgi:uncharacterized protein YbdZ (MbtH family)